MNKLNTVHCFGEEFVLFINVTLTQTHDDVCWSFLRLSHIVSLNVSPSWPPPQHKQKTHVIINSCSSVSVSVKRDTQSWRQKTRRTFNLLEEIWSKWLSVSDLVMIFSICQIAPSCFIFIVDEKKSVLICMKSQTPERNHLDQTFSFFYFSLAPPGFRR